MRPASCKWLGCHQKCMIWAKTVRRGLEKGGKEGEGGEGWVRLVYFKNERREYEEKRGRK